MLKRRTRFASRARRFMQAAAPEASRPATADALAATEPWPEPDSAGAASLWLCLVLPDLPLRAVGSPAAAAAVVVSEQRRGQVVTAVNTCAMRAGIAPGMQLNAARALNPELDVRLRDSAAEQAQLAGLADWACGWTSTVSVLPPHALLLEVRGSLRLFAGLQALRRQLLEGLLARGHSALAACAPTARAALWLAQAGHQHACFDTRRLPGLLGALPLAELGWSVKVVGQLREMGVTTLAGCLRLPRQGFARRVSVECLRELDQALGRAPELLPRHRQPPAFKQHIDFAGDTESVQQIAGFGGRLLEQLGSFLRRRQALVEQLELSLGHCGLPATELKLVLRQPCAQTTYLLELLTLRLECLKLPAPVTGLTLTAAAVPHSRSAGPAVLSLPGLATPDSAEQAEQTRRFIERLQARLGQGSVHGLEVVAEHRPERAWRRSGTAKGMPRPSAADWPAARPLWLLHRPRLISPLALASSSGLERIETGWWDGRDIRRDYQTVMGPRGSRWWVYRDRRDQRWYLHGLFG